MSDEPTQDFLSALYTELTVQNPNTNASFNNLKVKLAQQIDGSLTQDFPNALERMVATAYITRELGLDS